MFCEDAAEFEMRTPYFFLPVAIRYRMIISEKEEAAERIEERLEGEEKAFDPEDLRQLAVISADDLDLLMSKIDTFVQNDRMNSIMTPEEASLGQSIDFRG